MTALTCLAAGRCFFEGPMAFASAIPGPTSSPVAGAVEQPPPPAASASPGAAEGSGPAENGRPRPALELEAIDGTVINQGRIAGHALIVDFFATWCQPCHHALADLLAARDATAATAATTATAPVIVLVDLGESPTLVRQWAAASRLPAQVTVAVDPEGVAARRWGVHRLPTTILVDATGVVRHINRGWGPGYRGRLLRWLGDLAVPKAAAASSGPPR